MKLRMKCRAAQATNNPEVKFINLLSGQMCLPSAWAVHAPNFTTIMPSRHQVVSEEEEEEEVYM